MLSAPRGSAALQSPPHAAAGETSSRVSRSTPASPTLRQTSPASVLSPEGASHAASPRHNPRRQRPRGQIPTEQLIPLSRRGEPWAAPASGGLRRPGDSTCHAHPAAAASAPRARGAAPPPREAPPQSGFPAHPGRGRTGGNPESGRRGTALPRRPGSRLCPAPALARAPQSLCRGGRASWCLQGSEAPGEKGQRCSRVPAPAPSLSPQPPEPLSSPPPGAVKGAVNVHTHLAMDRRLGHPLAKLLEGVHRLQGGVGPEWEPLS